MKLFAEQALLPDGWHPDVLIDIDGDSIRTVTAHAKREGAQVVAGPLVPGMPNLHSHAFQRAMAGLTERAGPSGDNFWAWREQMYKFLERITPEDNAAIATQLYIEMLKSGYTSVAEFHYVHHDPAGVPYAQRTAMAESVVQAASTTRIGLTLLPVFYAHATFGGVPPNAAQRRFIHGVDDFGKLLEGVFTWLGSPKTRGVLRRIGIAPHSLRAVTPDELTAILAQLDAIDATAPVHIHAAEQLKEVNDCRTWSGKRPVAWLLEKHKLSARWCLVHATHLDDDETFRLANSGAIAGLCPSTEANLGDGIFNAPDYFMQHGHWGIGGDSHVGVDPFRELALVEYAQRLKSARRNILSTPSVPSIGGGLFRQALQGGATALGQKAGAIAAGYLADLVVMNADDVALAEQQGDAILDAAIFGPARQPVRDVMVGGAWVVQGGHHAREAEAFKKYRETLKRLLN
ncbi:MAG: formimidoylglutamate deiminase [Betaproteobacteria bacterium]|nr:formimidoylglutamate deiminase [Betaproteobacteria bacterium]